MKARLLLADYYKDRVSLSLLSYPTKMESLTLFGLNRDRYAEDLLDSLFQQEALH